MERKLSKGGNYGGGFLQLFDWNAKSRKKLFSTNSNSPEQSKQKKMCHGYSPVSQLQTMDEDEVAAGSSIKESSDFSCASSTTNEELNGPRAPGVVARLMGLDFLPKSNVSEPPTTPYFYSRSLHVAGYQIKDLARTYAEPKHQKEMNLPIKKFQTEVLPPKSAKSIPITNHKLLSPVKSVTFIPSKNAAHIMEAAAKIIQPVPQVTKRTKLPQIRSSSAPLRVKDLKEKVQTAKKQSNLSKGSQKSGESNNVKNLGRHPMNKSCNRSVDTAFKRIFQDSEESFVGVRDRGKSISLALQAKANVQKRDGLACGNSRNLAVQKETRDRSSNQLLKGPYTEEKSMLKKVSMSNGSSVLRQNDRKQNCIVHKGKLPLTSKPRSGRQTSGNVSSARQNNSCKLSGTSKVSSKKFLSEIKDDKREISSSSSDTVTHRKRSVDGNYPEKNQDTRNIRIDKNGKVSQSSAVVEKQSSWDQNGGRTGTDVISFTFSAPMTRFGALSGDSSEKRGNCEIVSGGCQSKMTPLSSDESIVPMFSFLGHSGKGGYSLSSILEKTLKELTQRVDLLQQKSGSLSYDAAPEENIIKDGKQADNLGLLEESGKCGSDISQARKTLDCQLLSPVSVLEHSSFADSCNSIDTTDSNSTGGSKQCSAIQTREVLYTYSSKMLGPVVGDSELSDSASSSSFETIAKKQETALFLANCEEPGMWELVYAKETLCNIEQMFKDYALGNAREVINPHLFEQLESWAECLNGCGRVPRLNRRALFDCVTECLDLRCRRYVGGGCKLWAKGVSVVSRKERLAEDVYNEISSLGAIDDSAIDGVVDKDMSMEHGRWLDFEIEAFEVGMQIESCIIDSLVDEVVAQILIV